jgi:CheY-like chemotaxis protein/AraC-like DNA-binding protein
MPRILIVEDEPAAGRYLRSVIELHRPAFTVAGIAGDGREALEQFENLAPDLVVTDIRMPVMDGIELVVELKKRNPRISVIIVSGYQEFEYARRALGTGVVDYLLKPVNPERLGEALDRLLPALSAREEDRYLDSLLRFSQGGRGESAHGCLSEERFWLALCRSGGLPSRFLFGETGREKAFRAGDLHVLPGRDSRECFLLGRAGMLPYEAFTSQLRAFAGESGEEASAGALPCIDRGEALGFLTLVVASGARPASNLQASLRDLCFDLDRILVAGLSQIHYGPIGKTAARGWDKPLADRMEFALGESRMDLLEKAVLDMAKAWKQARTPLFAVESELRRILLFVLRKAPRAELGMEADLEYLLEKELSAAKGFDDLAASAWSLVSKLAGAGDSGTRDSGVPAFFCAIKRYVEMRYAEPLSLASLSANFRISPSYLGKLFRQHAGRSFGEFISTIRIDAAKRLIGESPDMPLKKVAESVGFGDPFYFSRVFKSFAGYPPSDHARRGRGVRGASE